jgi:hypothetical protein
MAPDIAHLPFEDAGGDLQISLQRLNGICPLQTSLHTEIVLALARMIKKDYRLLANIAHHPSPLQILLP